MRVNVRRDEAPVCRENSEPDQAVMRDIVRGEAFENRLSNFDRKSLSIGVDTPSAEARGERALD